MYGVASLTSSTGLTERILRESGGVLDEARVNRVRYLDGTLKASTRWVDTGWALALVGAGP